MPANRARQDWGMATTDRAYRRGARTARRTLATLAEEFRERRIGLGLSQAAVAAAAGVSRTRYVRTEAGSVDTLSIAEATRLASVLGFDLSVRAYEGGDPLRDGGHARRLDEFARHVRRPLRFRREVPLPTTAQRIEQRAWDGEIDGTGRRTTVELEMRLRDSQAVGRRVALKRRDDPSDGFLLLVADPRHNRRVLLEHPDAFGDLKRLRPSVIYALLEAGEHPPSGLLLV